MGAAPSDFSVLFHLEWDPSENSLWGLGFEVQGLGLVSGFWVLGFTAGRAVSLGVGSKCFKRHVSLGVQLQKYLRSIFPFPETKQSLYLS